MSSKPSQTRTIDPFAEYNSNVANRLSRMLTQDADGLYSTNSLRLTADSTSPTTAVVVQTGMVFKDDVLIEITEDHRVDFTNPTHYVNYDGGPWGEVDLYYYVVLEYTYVKSRPAPDVDIKILKPSQRTVPLAESLLLLGVVKVSMAGSVSIDSTNPLWDYDPENPTNKREYIPFPFAGSETGLPTHDTFTHQSAIRYDALTDQFWLGYKDRWEQINAASLINIDTTAGLAVAVGDLCYVDASGQAQKAILSTVDKRAEFVVLETGFETDGTGQGRTYGVVENVPVATSVTMSVGDVCYLDSTEAGKITNIKPTQGSYQNVGKCIAVSGSTIDMLFIPGDFLSSTTTIVETLTALTDWTLSGGSYYANIDISNIGTKNAVVSLRDTADDKQISPEDIEFTSTSNLRIWMPVNTLTLVATVVG